jgi:hypothetical protein
MSDSAKRRRGLFASALVIAVAAVMVLALIPQAFAGYTWNDVKGPGDGDARALAYDSTHGILFRGTSNRGVWKYGGTTWASTGGGLTGYTVLSLFYNSSNDVLYAGTEGHGVWRCSNPGGSATWTDTAGGVAGMTVKALFSDGVNLYAGTSGQGVWRCSNPGVATPTWTSTGGPTITQGTPPAQYILTVNSLASDGASLYAGTIANGVWRCQNPASSPSWGKCLAAGDPDAATESTLTVYSLAFAGGRLYAGAAESGVWSCTNPGSTPDWKDAWRSTLTVNALVYDGSRLYAGAAGAGVHRTDAPTAAQPGWTSIGSGISSYTVFALAYAGAANTIYAGTENHGVQACAGPDTSPSWTGTGGNLSGYSVLSTAYDGSGNILYAGTDGHGVWRCTSPGTSPSWERITSGVAGLDGYIINALAYDGTHNVLFAGTGYNQQGVWRCAHPDSSPSWASMGIPSDIHGNPVEIRSLAYAPDFSGYDDFLYAGSIGYGVYRCPNPDTDTTWAAVCGFLIDPMNGYSAYCLAYDNVNHYLYAGTGGDGVWRNLTPYGFFPGWEAMGSLRFQTFYSVVYDEANDDLYVGSLGALRCHNPGGPSISITWTRILSIASGMAVKSLARDPATGTLYAGVAGQGLWRCTNPSSSPTWTDIWGNSDSVYTVAFNGSRVYAGTNLRGVYRCNNPGAVVPAFADTGGGISDDTVTAVAYDPAGNAVFAATADYHGVWRCDTPDTTPTWTSMGGDITGYTVKSLYYDGTHLYAGTYNNGVWRCDDPLGSPVWTNISGKKLNGVLALAANDVWVVGAGGTILHYNGSSWTRQVSGTSYDLYGIDALSASSIWVVGDHGTILHYDGSNWSPQSSGITRRLQGVGVLDSNNVWAVGDYNVPAMKGTILHYDGSTWSEQVSGGGDPTDVGDLVAVVPFSTNNVWAVGHEGASQDVPIDWRGLSAMMHYDGSSWHIEYRDTMAYLRGLTATDSSHMWSAGGAWEVGRDVHDDPIVQSSIFFYNGSSWSTQTAPNGTSDLYGISAYSNSNIWAVGAGGEILHYNGSSWASQTSGTSQRLNAVSARAANDIWAVGDGGKILHSTNGTTWNTDVDGIDADSADSLAFDGTNNLLYAGIAGRGVWRCAAPDTDPSWKNASGAMDGFTENALLHDGSLLYAATSGHGVWRCADPDVDSPTWTNMSDSSWSADSVFSLASDGARLYAGHQGVWRCDSPTSSSTWSDTGGAVADGIVRSLIYDGTDGVLLAGTSGNGIWRCISPASSPVWLDADGSLSGSVILSMALDGPTDRLYAGTQGAGLRLASVDPIPTVISCNPRSGYKGTTFDVTLTGAETGFANGVSDATFGPGITVNHVTVTNVTRATASVTIQSGAAAGQRDINVTTNTEVPAPLKSAFTVIRPKITAVTPSSWPRGQTIDLMIWGENTHFAQGTSRAIFGGSGITVNSTRVTDATHAEASVTISQTAAPGTREVNVLTGTESPDALVAEFNILAAKPHIDQLYPTSGPVGTGITIMGKNFGESRGSSKVLFTGGKSASAYSYWSPNLVKCTVPDGAKTGGVQVVTPGGTSNEAAFTVTSAESPTGIGSTWYLAEGTTDWGFDTYISIANPNAKQVTAKITYMTKTGPVEKTGLVLPAQSQVTVNPRADIGATDFSTMVECTTAGKPIAVDRTMTWTGPGAPSPEAHSSIGVTSPAKAWYLPEGSSAWGFECWLLIQNPSGSEAPCTVTYMVEGEGPRTVTKNVPAYSRASFNVKDDIGEKDTSIKVESPVPVIPERSMYRNNRREGHDSIGTTAPTRDFYLAEGTTNYGFTTYVLVQNPGSVEARVSVTYMTQSGPREQPAFTMLPNSRKTIRVNDVLPGSDFSTLVQGSVPIIAERSMYWGAGTPLGEACHDSIGMSEPHSCFYMPDGETSGGRETYVLVQNPNAKAVTVEVTYMTAGGGGNKSFTDTIPANSRKTYNMADRLPSSRAATMVKCKTSGLKIMVERSMYWNSRGAGTDTIGGFSD